MNINLVSLWDEIKDKKIVVYDLETTGFKSKNTRILSFSAIRYQVSEHGMDEIDRCDMFLNPMMTYENGKDATFALYVDGDKYKEMLETIEFPIYVGR